MTDAEAWDRAVSIAAGDRQRLANLVEKGLVRRVRGTWALSLPARPSTINLAIRPAKRRRRK